MVKSHRCLEVFDDWFSVVSGLHHKQDIHSAWSMLWHPEASSLQIWHFKATSLKWKPIIKTQHIQLVDCWKTNRGSIKVRLKYIDVQLQQNKMKRSKALKLACNGISMLAKDLRYRYWTQNFNIYTRYALVDRELKDLIESLLHIDYKNVSIAHIQST